MNAVTYARQRLGRNPNPVQERVLTAGDHDLVSDERRTGVTWGLAMRAIHLLETEPDCRIMVVAPSGQCLSYLMNTIRELMPSELFHQLARNSQAPQMLMLKDGRRIQGVHTDRGAMGQTATHLLMDRAQYVAPNLIQALQPILRSRECRFRLYTDTDE